MLQRQSLSIVIITKNESELLTETLDSVYWADEIILLDSGSSDATIKIASKYGVQIYESKNWMGFGKQRQLAQSFSTGDMILMLDADERITPELRHMIQKILEEPASEKVYSFKRSNLFLGRFMRYSGWYPDRVIRLYPRKLCYNENLVHESLNTQGAPIIALSGELKHLTCRDIIVFQHKQLNYAQAWAEGQFQRGRSCSIFSIFTHTISGFLKTILLQRAFLDGKYGWILAVVKAQYTFNKYLALWALHNTSRS
ncbi:glycosyltransferase family 2 protein [Candidatus Pantoea carbekii]|uniref:KdtX protein n=1 Tax=Candidatus Pantoea carbekii TaxID=1235990 RepID=U3U731_9GAMM|nr:glycosyltransferase family 2 protein [Candidatus Pantoea carbekii]AKC32340.1 lipopolysaccharide core biosynthesis glycosyl transferase KdtX [Candidatus Pantoea carbekii]BAO00059.1 KdtX protein [Candidatus Pantoea carbekii]